MPLIKASSFDSISTTGSGPSSYGASLVCHATLLAIGETPGALSVPTSAKYHKFQFQFA